MLRAEFGAALMLLTRVPALWVVGGRPFPAAGRCLWAYPVVGALIGAVGAGVFEACRMVGMPAGLASIWTMVALALVSGALHEDGLADMADGFGGGRTRERKLEIMRDSRIGSYGVLALILAVAVRVVAIAAISTTLGAGLALVAAGALSRAAMAGPALLLPAAREAGLGAGLRAEWGAGAAGAGLGCVIALAALPVGVAVAAIAVAGGVALATTGLARVQIGGFTGDVLGGCAVVTECAVLTVAACS